MDAYSMDLRERIVRAVDEGVEARVAIARTFGVTTRWIRKLIQQRRETGSIELSPHAGGWEPKFTAERLERLKKTGGEESRRYARRTSQEQPRLVLQHDGVASAEATGLHAQKIDTTCQ